MSGPRRNGTLSIVEMGHFYQYIGLDSGPISPKSPTTDERVCRAHKTMHYHQVIEVS
jgi:hypothetical protein